MKRQRDGRQENAIQSEKLMQEIAVINRSFQKKKRERTEKKIKVKIYQRNKTRKFPPNINI